MLYGAGLSTLLSLAVLAVLVAGAVAALRRLGGEPGGPGIGGTRRLFTYGLAFVALMLTTLGATLLVDQLLGALFLDAVIRGDSFPVAFGISTLLVGAPVWALLWRAAGRSVAQFPAERGTFGRKLYLYLVMGVAAAVTAGGLTQVVQGLLAGSAQVVDSLATVLVWGGLWAVHWRWETAEGQPTPVAQTVRRLYVYATGVYGLVLLAFGVATALATLLGAAYDALVGTPLVGGGAGLWGPNLRGALGAMAVGAAWWWFHWHRTAAADAASLLRQAVTAVVGIFGGLVATVTAAAVALHAVLDWLIVRPQFSGAGAHFSGVPTAIAVALVAGGVFGYHASVYLRETASVPGRGVSALRAHHYLSAGVGLATLSLGLVMLLGTLVGLLVPAAQETIAGSSWWDTPLSVALTLLAVGGPVWWAYWFRQQRAAEADPAERAAASRRFLVFLALGASVLAALGGLSAFLFMLIQPLLEGTFSARVLDGGKWALAVALTAGAVAAYYAQVLREDRAAAPVGPERLGKALTLVLPAGAEALAEGLGERLGVRAERWVRADDAPAPALGAAEMDALAGRIRQAPGERVLVVIGPEGAQVIGL
jgi:hypothetical protein